MESPRLAPGLHEEEEEEEVGGGGGGAAHGLQVEAVTGAVMAPLTVVVAVRLGPGVVMVVLVGVVVA